MNNVPHTFPGSNAILFAFISIGFNIDIIILTAKTTRTINITSTSFNYFTGAAQFGVPEVVMRTNLRCP